MTITKVQTFIFSNGIRVEFVPVSDVPGFTHKVYILKIDADSKLRTLARDWFAPVAGRISSKVAQFFYDKHMKAAA